jgi:hypothetical protein
MPFFHYRPHGCRRRLITGLALLTSAAIIYTLLQGEKEREDGTGIERNEPEIRGRKVQRQTVFSSGTL